MENLTIAIITYKRPKLLSYCLKSICNQEYYPKNILLIDNDFQKSAHKIYKKFKNKIPIKYFNEPIKNISLVRNLALDNCKTNFLAFIDDDCTISKNWSKNTKLIINSRYKKTAFFQGSATSKNLDNPLVLAQHKIYQKWINDNKKGIWFNPMAIDTKNLILNLKIINKFKIRFDINLPIFEDTDFGLQLKKHKLKGQFFSKISVTHREISDFKKAIKKFFYRGKIKYILNQKWKEFDRFSPNIFQEIKAFIKHPKKIFETILNLSFDFGFLTAKNKKLKISQNTVFIVNYLDKGANEERTSQISNFLKQNRFQTKTIDSQMLFTKALKSFSGFINWPFDFLICRFLRVIVFKLKITYLKSLLLYKEIIFRGKVIKKYLIKHQSKIVISQFSEDFCCSLNQNKFKIILDLPTIYSEEFRLNFPNSKNIIKKIENLEKSALNQSNQVCFHWYSFLKLAEKIKKKTKNNFVLNWGCNSQKKTSRFKTKAKIIYLGNLNSPWINPNLLELIQKKSVIPLDIYSYEKPNIKIYSSLRSRGFMKSLKNIDYFQFGLLTFTDDNLRNNGFSAKHLMYLSHGLPVLCPEWRKDKLLEPATIYYNANNFNEQIKKYLKKNNWQKKHQAAIMLAKKLNWNQTLKPLLPIIYKLQNEIK